MSAACRSPTACCWPTPCRRRWRRWRGAGSTSSPTGTWRWSSRSPPRSWPSSMSRWRSATSSIRASSAPASAPTGLELYTYSDRLAAVWRRPAGAGLPARRGGAAARRHGAGLRRGRQGLPDRHGRAAGPAARLLVPRPGCGADRPGLRLSPLRLRRGHARNHDAGSVSGNRDCRSTRCAPCSSSACASALRHAYEHQAPYRAKCQAAGVHPDDLRQLDDLAALSLHRQGRPARRLSLRHAGHPAREVRAHPCLERHDRPADGGRLLGARHRHLGRPDGALALRRRRAAGRHHPQRLRLRPVHRRAGRALRRRAAGLHRGADVGRLRRAPGPAHPRVRRAGRADDAVLHAGDRRRVRAPGRRSARAPRCASASSAPSRGPRACAPRSSGGSASTPSTSMA